VSDELVPPPLGEFLLHHSDDGRSRLEIRFDGETLWLTQAQLAELFQTSVPNVNAHLRSLLAEGEIAAEATIKQDLIVRSEGGRTTSRAVNHYAVAADYVPSAEETTRGFQVVQNKLHYAVTGHTAPEIIARRVDADAPNMGLTDWKGSRVSRTDVTVAKNYLLEPEITELNRIVIMFLDFAEDQASRRKQVFLRDWEQRLDDFLRFNERTVLGDGGSVSRAEANQRASDAFEAFAVRRHAEVEEAAEDAAIKELERLTKALPKRSGRRKREEGE
jgi:hypothetical protein